jgi:hypothetical protein
MWRRLCVTALGLCCAGLAGCGGSDEATCTINDDCVAGHLCQDGACIQCDRVRILTGSLPGGILEAPYEFPLEAADGVAPYSWSLVDSPGWMSIDPESGKLSGTPDAAASGLPVLARVEDSTAGRDSFAEADLAIDVDVCVDGSKIACYQPDQGKCMDGTRTCSGGRWGECVTTGTSVDVEHCGPDCGPCDDRVANRCLRGSCACGDSSPCTGNEICCDNACVDASSDASNCGGCGADCADLLQNVDNPHCQEGACVHDGCLFGFMDCNGEPRDGCETDVTLVERCGDCERDCTELTRHVVEIVCSDDAGTYDCGYNQTPGCEFGFLDCDAEPRNGCETPVSDQDCGACGLACVDSVCRLHPSGDRYYCGCSQDADCGAQRQCCQGYCFDLFDPFHCGDCANDCRTQVANVNAEDILCDQGVCDYVQCAQNFLDCDGDRQNGCEQAMDDDNCGECGFSCGVNAHCVEGGCACVAGRGNCDGDWTNGCEIDLQNDLGNCGACDNDCGTEIQNATVPVCSSGQCDYQDCLSEYGDCDDDRQNGCEAHLLSDEQNCGACQVVCQQNHGSNNCMSGRCQPICHSGWGDCDGITVNGCETDLLNDTQNCGSCDTDCNVQIQHASNPRCESGQCDFFRCQGDYRDCNEDRTDGCEIDISSDVNNCGNCGFKCKPDPYCCDGLCSINPC